jgi:hypothetical protein
VGAILHWLSYETEIKQASTRGALVGGHTLLLAGQDTPGGLISGIFDRGSSQEHLRGDQKDDHRPRAFPPEERRGYIEGILAEIEM